jgi:CHASE3 domain sensor protein
MTQNKLTVGAKIALTTGALACMLVLMACYGLYAIGEIGGSFEVTADKTVRRAIVIGELSQAVSDMAAGQRGLLAFAYAKDPMLQANARQLFQTSVSRVQESLVEIQPILATEEGKRRVADISSGLSQWLSAYGDMERLVDAGDPDGAVKLLAQRITPHYNAVSEDCRQLAVLVNQVLQAEKQTVREQNATAHWLMIVLLAAGAAAAVMTLLVARSVTHQLRQLAAEMLDGSRQVAAAAGQVAAASQSLAQGSSEQAATLEETSSSTSEITAITRKNSENTRSVAGLMEQTAKLVGGANHNLEEMVRSMNEINGSSQKISKIINKTVSV